MNCPHGRKAIACADCHPEGPPRELLEFISSIAESKTLLLLARGAGAGSPERRFALERLALSNRAMRERVDALGGLEALPHKLAVEVRVCELGAERMPR